jgi:hypothetical protein
MSFLNTQPRRDCYLPCLDDSTAPPATPFDVGPARCIGVGFVVYGLARLLVGIDIAGFRWIGPGIVAFVSIVCVLDKRSSDRERALVTDTLTIGPLLHLTASYHNIFFDTHPNILFEDITTWDRTSEDPVLPTTWHELRR